jgi:hypothetical protein
MIMSGMMSSPVTVLVGGCLPSCFQLVADDWFGIARCRLSFAGSSHTRAAPFLASFSSLRCYLPSRLPVSGPRIFRNIPSLLKNTCLHIAALILAPVAYRLSPIHPLVKYPGLWQSIVRDYWRSQLPVGTASIVIIVLCTRGTNQSSA